MKRYLLLLVTAIAVSTTTLGQKTWDGGAGTSNWGDANNWNPDGVPGPADAVNLATLVSATAIDVNVAATAASIAYPAANAFNVTVSILSGQSLTVGGAITIPNAGAANFNTLAVSAGTLSAGSIAFTGANATPGHRVIISTGTATVTGDITVTPNGASATIAFSGAGTLNAGGLLLYNGATSTGTLTTIAGSTVNYNGAAQTIKPVTYLGNVTLSGSGIKSIAAATAIDGTLTISSGVTLQASTTSVLTLRGNMVNNGTFNGDDAADVNITFNGTANQTVSGTGAQTEFALIVVNNTGADGSNIVEIAPSNYSLAPPPFLTFTDGIIKFSGTSTINSNLLTPAGYTIPANTGLWINNPNMTITAQGASPTLDGTLRISAGTLNIGLASADDLEYNTGASLIIEGGNLNLASRLVGQTPGTDQLIFNMSGGTLSVATVSNTTNNNGSFDIGATGSSFTMSGGTIILVNESTAAQPLDYRNVATTFNVTGGTVQFGTAAIAGSPTFVVGISPTLNVLPGVSIPDAAAGTTTVTAVTPISILGNVNIGATNTLAVGTQAVSIAGNFTNNGTYSTGVQTTTFNGTTAQTINGSTSTTFSTVVFNNTAAGLAIIFATGATVAVNATFTDGLVSTSTTNFLSFNDNATATGAGLSQATDASYVVGPVLKTGNDAFVFPIGSFPTGGYMPLSISAPDNVADALRAEYVRASATALGPVLPPLINVSNCDYWNVVETTDVGGATTVNITLSWDNGSPCGTAPFITNLSGLSIGELTAGTWIEVGTPGSTTGTTTTGTITRNGINAFAQVSLANTLINENPLPVKFSSIRAYEKAGGVQIDWTAYDEQNLNNYVIERSSNGTNFIDIGSVNARNVPGSQQYGFLDPSPLPGINFYRLKSVDLDSRIGYSNIVKVNLDPSSTDITLYPNPVVNGQVAFQTGNLPKGTYAVRIFNAGGQQVFTQTFNHNGGAFSQTIQLPAGLRTGYYSLQLEKDGGRVGSKSFTMQ